MKFCHWATILFCLGISLESFGRDAWFSNDYRYRKKLTLDSTLVAGASDLTNFPILISLTDSDLRTSANSGQLLNANGYDLIFTTSDSTAPVQLDHEVESYTATSGNIVIWVRIPTLTTATDTTIYMYYSNPLIATSQEDRNGTWNSNYVAVYHMNGADGAGETDSTSNSYAMTLNGTVGATTSGQIGNGRTRPTVGSTNYLTRADSVDLDNLSQMTVQGWLYSTTATPSSDVRGVISKRNNSNAAHSWGVFIYTNDKLNFDNGNAAGTNFDTRTASVAGIAANTWTMFHCIFDGTVAAGSRKKIYLNGAIDITATANVTTITNTASAMSAFLLTGNTGSMRGHLDELRVLKTALSADWITTEYNNHNNQGTGVGKFIKAISPQEIKRRIILTD